MHQLKNLNYEFRIAFRMRNENRKDIKKFTGKNMALNLKSSKKTDMCLRDKKIYSIKLFSMFSRL